MSNIDATIIASIKNAASIKELCDAISEANNMLDTEACEAEESFANDESGDAPVPQERRQLSEVVDLTDLPVWGDEPKNITKYSAVWSWDTTTDGRDELLIVGDGDWEVYVDDVDED